MCATAFASAIPGVAKDNTIFRFVGQFVGQSPFRTPASRDFAVLLRKNGAGDGDRTRNIQLGKLTLYH